MPGEVGESIDPKPLKHVSDDRSVARALSFPGGDAEKLQERIRVFQESVEQDVVLYGLVET
jgi:hypothetical protein